MSLSRVIHGRSAAIFRKLDTLDPVAVVTGSTNIRPLVSMVRLARTGGTPTVTVEVYKAGASASYRQSRVTLTQDTPTDIDMAGLNLENNDELRVTASSTDQVEVTVWTIQPSEGRSTSI